MIFFYFHVDNIKKTTSASYVFWKNNEAHFVIAFTLVIAAQVLSLRTGIPFS